LQRFVSENERRKTRDVSTTRETRSTTRIGSCEEREARQTRVPTLMTEKKKTIVSEGSLETRRERKKNRNSLAIVQDQHDWRR